jgi:hypothetical protein
MENTAGGEFALNENIPGAKFAFAQVGQMDYSLPNCSKLY